MTPTTKAPNYDERKVLRAVFEALKEEKHTEAIEALMEYVLMREGLTARVEYYYEGLELFVEEISQ